MQLRIVLPALLVLSLGSNLATPATGIRFAPAEGLALRKTFEKDSQQELDWIRVTMSGQEEEQDQGQQSRSTSRLVVVDRYVSVSEARVEQLERSYEDFEGEQTTAVTAGGEDDTLESETSCELVGHAVSFTWDSDAEAYVARSADEEVEADWLGELGYELELLALLPEGEVEIGEEWEVDAEAFRGALRFEQGLPLEAEPATEGEDAEEPEESVSGTLTARFAGTREEDGAALAVIELSGEYQVSADSERTVEVENGTRTSQLSQTTKVELEGELLWNLAAAHFQAGSLEAESATRTSVDIRFEVADQTIELSQESSASGSVTFRARFEPAD